MRFFSGEGWSLGTVNALAQQTFQELCEQVLTKPIRLKLERAEFFTLPKKNRADPDGPDQSKAKRVRYITPATFKSSPSNRDYEHAMRCNLIALDIDDSVEAKRLLTQKWEDSFGELGFIVWKTVSSTEQNPRLRVLVNADGISRENYPAALRTIAEMIGLTAITHESKVVVQPMFLPTIFSDDSADVSPIVALNAEGDPFRSADIIPDDESSLVDAPRNPTSGSSSNSGEIADLEYLRTPVEGVTLGDAKGAIEHLDPDMPMQQWIEVAAGLKHQFKDREEEAFAMWDEWSSRGKKYDDSESTRYRWNTLKAQPTDRAPVTIRSVFKAAQARGWSNQALASRNYKETMEWIKSGARATEQLMDEGPKRIAKLGGIVGQLERKTLMIALKDVLASRDMPIPVADIKKAVRQLEMETIKTTGIPPWTKALCFVTALNIFYRYTTDRKFLPEVLDLMYSAPSNGDDRPLRPRDIAIMFANIPQVENLRYDPSQGTKRFFTDGGIPYVNTYRPDYAAPIVETAEEAGAVYWDHVIKLTGEAKWARLLTDYLAYMVKHPGKKIRWAPLIQSGEGAGKTAIHAMMTAVLGRRNTSKVNGSTIMESNFNAWAYGRQLVTIEEVRIVGANRHTVMDKLKPCITDDDLEFHKKHEDPRTVANITNYMMFTNYHDALAIREDGRRYFVLQSPLQSPRDIEAIGGKRHFDRIYRMVRENAGGLRAWFEMWDFSPEFDPEGRAPTTPFLREFAENAESPLAAIVRNTIEDEPHPLVRKDLLTLDCLRGCMDTTNLAHFSDQALAGVLRELGWRKVSRLMIDGLKRQLWSKKDFEDPREIAELRMRLMG